MSKHFVHTDEGPGRVRRVTAAVVVNDREVAEAGKPVVWRARTQEEMHRMEALAQGAVGFDEKRGDVVTMENVGFSSNVPEVKAAGVGKVLEEAKGLAGSQPGLVKTGVLGVLGLLVVLLVLRPLAGQVVATLKEPALLERTETKMLAAEAACRLRRGCDGRRCRWGRRASGRLRGSRCLSRCRSMCGGSRRRVRGCCRPGSAGGGRRARKRY